MDSGSPPGLPEFTEEDRKVKKEDNILFFMVISLFFTYLPWYSFSAVSNLITTELALSTTQLGYILSSFQVGYVITVLVTGFLADRFKPKIVILSASFGTAITAILFPFYAKGFISVMLLRLSTGLFSGAIYAPGMALLSSWFEPGKRGKAIGAYTAGLTMSYAGGYFITSPLAGIIGWRSGMFFCALPTFLSVFFIYRFISNGTLDGDPLEKNGAVQRSSKDPEPAPEGGFKGPAVLTLGYMGHMWELYAFWGWIGPFLVANLVHSGFPLGKAVSLGGIGASVAIAAGAAGVWMAGSISDRAGRIKVIMAVSICSIIGNGIFGFTFGKGLATVSVLAIWIGFWTIADSGIYKAALTEMTRPHIRSSALGAQSALGYLPTIVAPVVFGKMLEIYNPGITDMSNATNWGMSFLILGAGALLAPLSMLILTRLPQSKLIHSRKTEMKI